MESCDRATSDLFSAMLSPKGYIGIPCLIWMILPSLCHRCLVYQSMNCWMCLKLLDLLKKGREERIVAIHEIQVHGFYQPERSRRVSGA